VSCDPDQAYQTMNAWIEMSIVKSSDNNGICRAVALWAILREPNGHMSV
jgi:hypothetical protein